MDPHLVALIRRNSKKPLPELKLELMKHGFSSYQIEDALEELKIKNIYFIRTFAVLLVLAVIVLAIGFVFVSFVGPAEKLVAREPAGKPSGNEIVQEAIVPSVLPSGEPEEISEEIVKEPVSGISEEDEAGSSEETVAKPQPSLSSPFAEKDIEEIRELSVLQKEKALSECGLLSDARKDSCISLVARTVGDPGLCSSVIDSQARDYCFYFFGQSNKEFCGEISSITLRNYCTTIAGISQRAQ